MKRIMLASALLTFSVTAMAQTSGTADAKISPLGQTGSMVLTINGLAAQQIYDGMTNIQPQASYYSEQQKQDSIAKLEALKGTGRVPEDALNKLIEAAKADKGVEAGLKSAENVSCTRTINSDSSISVSCELVIDASGNIQQAPRG